MIKVISVVGDAANRDLGAFIEKKVEETLVGLGGKLTGLQIDADHQAGGYGKALVVINYEKGAASAPKGKKK